MRTPRNSCVVVSDQSSSPRPIWKKFAGPSMNVLPSAVTMSRTNSSTGTLSRTCARTQLWKLHMPFSCSAVRLMRSRSPHFSAHQSMNSAALQHLVDGLRALLRVLVVEERRAPRPASAACRSRRGTAAAGTRRRSQSGDGVRPSSFHFAMSFSSMKLFAGRSGNLSSFANGSVTCATSAWPPKRIMTCVSPASFAVTSPSARTAATASLSASNCAVGVTSSRVPSDQIAVIESCCCSPGTMSRVAGNTSSLVTVASAFAAGAARRLRATGAR